MRSFSHTILGALIAVVGVTFAIMILYPALYWHSRLVRMSPYRDSSGLTVVALFGRRSGRSCR